MSIQAPRPPHWLAMTPIGRPEAAWSRSGRDLILAVPRTSRQISTLRTLRRCPGFDARFDVFLRWWRISPRTCLAQDLMHALLDELKPEPMPRSDLECALAAAILRPVPGSFWLADDVYHLRLRPEDPAAIDVLGIAADLGIHAEWGRVDLQVFARSNHAHRSLRAVMLTHRMRLHTDLLSGFVLPDAAAQPAAVREWTGARAA